MGDRSFEALLAQGRELSRKGRVREACTTYREAEAYGRRSTNQNWQAKALVSLSGCRIRLFDYQGARSAAVEARELAEKAGNHAVAGTASINLASIYSQLGDVQLADREAEQATRLLKDTANKTYLAKALLLYANIEADLLSGRLEAEHDRKDTAGGRRDLDQLQRNYRNGVEVAHTAGLSAEEAQLWEELGQALLIAKHPAEAEDPLRKANLLIMAAHDQGALAVNQEHQAELQLQKGDYQAALKLIDQALASPSEYFRTEPKYYSLHVRGLVLLHLNRENEALSDLRRAVDSATEWRQRALPGDATATRTVVFLHQIYRDYAQLAADLSLRRHDTELARQGFEALAENRAANLREQITRALGEKLQLPPRYYDLLTELQAAQARVSLGDDSRAEKVRLDQIRLEIDGIENGLGLNAYKSSNRSEKNARRNSLKDIQASLSADETLLSFSLGKNQSFLWMITKDQVRLNKLVGESELGHVARQYSRAVEDEQSCALLGQQLSRDLFGGLPADLWAKKQWLIVGDGALLDGVPFSSLPDLHVAEKPAPLVAHHSLRFLPSELLLLAPDPPRPRPAFVGVGDPIYNAADSRRSSQRNPSSAAPRASVALSRLPGSAREVRAAAKQSGLPKSDILTGSQATVNDLQEAVAERPEILHFAVHVVSPDSADPGDPGASSQAALALSLTRDNMPELLTPEAIAALRVPGSLVILSGCSSQKGEILPGAGLMGLSRAWLLAGASAVVVSAWPTPDDSGKLFSSFYSYLQAASGASLPQRAALALEKAQIDMQQGGGFRSLPKFWAAYSLVSKE